MTEERINKGNNIVIHTDQEFVNGIEYPDKVFVVIEDGEGNLILKIQRNLWKNNDEISGLTKEMRADFIDKIMARYG